MSQPTAEDVRAEVKAWLEENWDPDITVGEWWDRLARSGYATGIFGKWHLGDHYPSRPQDRGFARTFIHGGGGVGQTPDYWGNDYFDDTFFDDGRPRPTPGYCTDVWFDAALGFTDFIGWFDVGGLPAATVETSMRRFAAEVMPRFAEVVQSAGVGA